MIIVITIIVTILVIIINIVNSSNNKIIIECNNKEVDPEIVPQIR